MKHRFGNGSIKPLPDCGSTGSGTCLRFMKHTLRDLPASTSGANPDLRPADGTGQSPSTELAIADKIHYVNPTSAYVI